MSKRQMIRFAEIVSMRLADVASLTEIHSDYLVYTATFFTVDRAIAIASQIEEDFGITIAIRS